MNPFLTRATGHSWLLWVSVLCLVLGFMLKLAWIPRGQAFGRIGQMDADQATRMQYGKYDADLLQQNQDLGQQNQYLTEEVSKLRKEKTRLENSIGTQTNQANILNDSLQESKLFAGLTPVEGPGVLVTLQDSEREAAALSREKVDLIIHDIDVLRVVNELRASGAEAISINDRRIAGKSSIRCVGPTILIDNNQVSTPIRIKAIGNAETLYGGLNLRGGVLDELRQTGDPSMVRMERVEKQLLPAYDGSTIFKYSKPAEDSK